MITHIQIRNFRSFLKAEAALQPFSLVVGANGSGKSNLFKFFEVISQATKAGQRAGGGPILSEGSLRSDTIWRGHRNIASDEAGFSLLFADKPKFTGIRRILPNGNHVMEVNQPSLWFPRVVPIFNLDPEKITGVEQVKPKARVSANGIGTTQVLDMLKNGDREDLFDSIESHFRRYVPEVEKLSLSTVEQGLKQIQVRERGLNDPTPGPELSEGTRLILAILTIIHQEEPPPIILLEDIDRGMHPRLFEYIAPLMRDIAVRMGVNILATTHNPYLVDAFQENREAVIIVEKENGASTLTTLEQKMEGLHYDELDPADMPLGQLWFSGLVGGTPRKIGNRPQP